MGRHHEVELQIRLLHFLQQRLNGRQTCHHAALVQVGHNGGGAVLQQDLRQRLQRQAGAFRMYVPVDKARRDIIALRVNDDGVFPMV